MFKNYCQYCVTLFTLIKTPCYSMSSAFSLPYHPLCYSIYCVTRHDDWRFCLSTHFAQFLLRSFLYLYVFWWSLFYHHYRYCYFISWDDMAKILTWYKKGFKGINILKVLFLSFHPKNFFCYSSTCFCCQAVTNLIHISFFRLYM